MRKFNVVFGLFVCFLSFLGARCLYAVSDVFSNTLGSVMVEKGIVSDSSKFNVDYLEVPSDIKSQFGDNSRYLDIYFSDEEGNRTDFSGSAEVTLSLDKDKNLKAVYEVLDSGEFSLISYDVKDYTVIFDSDSLGKYVIVYDKASSQIVSDSDLDGNFLIYVVVGAVVVLVVVFVFVSKKK